MAVREVDVYKRQVVYSPYVLGPYALGTVELKVSYQEIEDLLGPGGQERLGIGSTEEAE